MKIEFVLREPGNHHVIHTADYPAVPREGECVALDDDNASYTVHSVTHDIRRGIVSVLVKR